MLYIYICYIYIYVTLIALQAVCNHKFCAQVYELPQSHCGDNFFMIL